MDRPFALILDAYYHWILDRTNPVGFAEDGIEHVPKHFNLPFGKLWNLWWYQDLALKTGLSTEEELATVKPARQIPASYHTYNNEFDSVRQAVEGVAAMKRNYVNTNGYKRLVEAEKSCVERARFGYDFTPPNTIRAAEGLCLFPKQMYLRDVSESIDEWRAIAVTCLTRHSAEHGDGNRQAFNECIDNFTQELIQKGTTASSLDEWADKYLNKFTLGALGLKPEE